MNKTEEFDERLKQEWSLSDEVCSKCGEGEVLVNPEKSEYYCGKCAAPQYPQNENVTVLKDKISEEIPTVFEHLRNLDKKENTEHKNDNNELKEHNKPKHINPSIDKQHSTNQQSQIRESGSQIMVKPEEELGQKGPENFDIPLDSRTKSAEEIKVNSQSSEITVNKPNNLEDASVPDMNEKSCPRRAELPKINSQPGSSLKKEDKSSRVGSPVNESESRINTKAILFDKSEQEKLLQEERIEDHHHFFQANMENHRIIMQYIHKTAKELSARVKKEKKIDKQSLKVFYRLLEAQKQIDRTQISLLNAAKNKCEK